MHYTLKLTYLWKNHTFIENIRRSTFEKNIENYNSLELTDEPLLWDDGPMLECDDCELCEDRRLDPGERLPIETWSLCLLRAEGLGLCCSSWLLGVVVVPAPVTQKVVIPFESTATQ